MPWSNFGENFFFLQNFILFHPFESINFQPAGLLKIALTVTPLLIEDIIFKSCYLSIHLSNYISFHPVDLSIRLLFLYQSFIYSSIYLFIFSSCRFIYPSFIHVSTFYLFIYSSMYLSIHPVSIYKSFIYVSIFYLFIHLLSIYPSFIDLSIFYPSFMCLSVFYLSIIYLVETYGNACSARSKEV